MWCKGTSKRAKYKIIKFILYFRAEVPLTKSTYEHFTLSVLHFTYFDIMLLKKCSRDSREHEKRF